MRPARPPARLPIFRSAEQARLLQSLFLWPERTWTFHELATGGPSSATVDRELKGIVDAGIVSVARVGRTRTFTANRHSPLYRPLSQLIERTLGVEVLLREALLKVDGVNAASIFGSWAAGLPKEESDVDVLVVGNVENNRLVTVLHPVARAIGREVNTIGYSPEEFDQKLADADGFLRRIVEGPRIDLVGNLGELARAVPR